MATPLAPPHRRLLRLAVVLLLWAAACVVLASATDHIVGGHLGWNPNINYTLWSNNQTFYVDDLVSFRYQKYMYNVFEVNRTGYENCTMDGVVGNWTSGKDFIPLPEAKTYYFICNGFCLNGMKVAVTVIRNATADAGNGTLASGGSHKNSTSSATPRQLRHWPAAAALAAIAVAAAWI